MQKFLMNAKNATTVAGQMNGTFGSASNQLFQPTGIYLNSNGDIFVSDTNNNRIQWWINGATSGTTVVGNGKVFINKTTSEKSYFIFFVICQAIIIYL